MFDPPQSLRYCSSSTATRGTPKQRWSIMDETSQQGPSFSKGDSGLAVNVTDQGKRETRCAFGTCGSSRLKSEPSTDEQGVLGSSAQSVPSPLLVREHPSGGSSAWMGPKRKRACSCAASCAILQRFGLPSRLSFWCQGTWRALQLLMLAVYQLPAGFGVQGLRQDWENLAFCGICLLPWTRQRNNIRCGWTHQ